MTRPASGNVTSAMCALAAALALTVSLAAVSAGPATSKGGLVAKTGVEEIVFAVRQPGKTTGCVGCHERRTDVAPAGRRLLALRRGASAIRPLESAPDVPDFPRDIQPILDEHCVGCHNPDRREGKVDLTGDRTGVYSISYWAIIRRRLVADGRNQRYGNRPPRTIGTSASRLMKLIDGGHYEARPSARQRRTVRAWIEVGSPYAGTYAAYFSGMVPVRFPVREMTARCGRCHAAKPGRHRKQAWEGYDIRPWASPPVELPAAGRGVPRRKHN